MYIILQIEYNKLHLRYCYILDTATYQWTHSESLAWPLTSGPYPLQKQHHRPFSYITTVFLMKPWQKLSVLVLYAIGKEVFCIRSDNKRTKSKVFFDLLVLGLKKKRSTCTLPKTISRPYQIALLRPRIFGPQTQKRSACGKNVWDQIKMFCFCSDSKRTKSKYFAFVPIISFDIETFVLAFRYRWHY